MSIRMPLAGDNPRKAKQFDREEAEERAFRMLSEGELFYVETDVHDDPLVSTRHDHGHLGGVSLETITAARFPGQAAKKGPSSIESRETAATSRSSSQDTQENDNNTWHQQPAQPLRPQGLGERVLASSPARPAFAGTSNNNGCRVSLREAQEWDFHKKLEDIEACERRGRQRSSSEPQLHSLRAGGGHQHTPLEWHRPQQYRQREDMGTVNEWCSATGLKMPSRASFSPPQLPPRRNSLRDPCADACAQLTNGIQRAWSSVFGDGEEEQYTHGIGTLRHKPKQQQQPARVSSVSRNFASCTSTKTFESSPTYTKALRRLGVDPDTTTFTMHVAGYRLVSTILGTHAEFQVCVKGGACRWSRWQRFSRFKTIAACTEADPDAAAAWKRILRAKPAFRCLNADYLALKCNLLEVFLQQVLFAMPTPAILIHFVSEK